MKTQGAVFFDVDGVLLDSLPQHLAYCSLKAKQYGLLDVHVPTVEGFRRLVMDGTRVSPMVNFFLAVGFPRKSAERADDDYRHEFAQRFPSKTFPGVREMLMKLHAAGISLGLVTANVRENVEPPLLEYMSYFDPRCLFFFERSARSNDKKAHLREGARILRLPPPRCTFVGDQPADAAAAHSADLAFLGVSYGWGFRKGTEGERIVDAVSEIAPRILADKEAILR
jgi:phosphoglycolate phosphatase-like HAD superfamily hydrolase